MIRRHEMSRTERTLKRAACDPSCLDSNDQDEDCHRQRFVDGNDVRRAIAQLIEFYER